MSLIIFLAMSILYFSQSNLSSADNIDCYPLETDPKVCKCNSTHCDDTIKVNWCPEDEILQIYTTSDYGARIRPSQSYFRGPNPHAQFTLRVDPSTKYQTIFGFGGALTDSAAIMISYLPESAKNFLMNNYFNCDVGLGYNMIRVNLGACDFSPEFYTYCDSTTSTCSSDPDLSCFNLHYYDTHIKIPLLQLAQDISCKNIHIKGATWNAPKWMTLTKEVSTDDIAPLVPPEFGLVIPPTWNKTFVIETEDCYEAWANYYVKTIEAYGFCKLNSPFILSVANEPFVSLVSLKFTPENYKTFLTDYLCPKIRNLNCIHPIRIMVNDDQTPFLDKHIQTLLSDPETNSCIDIVGTHWYLDIERTPKQQEFVRQQHETFSQQNPDKSLWRSESTIAWNDIEYSQSDWEKAVKYIKDIIIAFKGNVEAYLDWNIALDMDGGPNWVDNFCEAAIKIDPAKGEFYKKILFYALGQVSKFIIPESTVRVKIVNEVNENSSPQLEEDLFYVAFKVSAPDCKRSNLVVLILNTNDNEYKGDICVGDYDCASITVSAKSIITTVSTLPIEV